MPICVADLVAAGFGRPVQNHALLDRPGGLPPGRSASGSPIAVSTWTREDHRKVGKCKRQQHAGDQNDQDGIRFLAEMFGRFEMRDWGLEKWQIQLALVSPVFKELLRPAVGDPQNELVNVTAIWRAAGEPADKKPLEWIASSWKPEDHLVEDRGADGVWVDFETAAWYASGLDGRLDSAHVTWMLY
jgi:hypothetical protein